MKYFLTTFTLCALFSTASVMAHDGHDHDAPGAMKAPHGGTTQGGKNIDIELVQEKDGILVYGLEEDASSVAAKDFQLIGTAEFPKKSSQPLTFSAQKDHYAAKFSFKDAKGKLVSHRAKITLQVTPAKEAPESFVFQLEPQGE